MDTKAVLAIDFGTSNTYCCRCPGDQLSPTGVDFGDGRDGLASAILYRNGKPPLIGHVALEEYGEATASERDAYDLKARFKPDIAESDEARRAATDFLSEVLAEGRRQRIDLSTEGREVIFGVPSEADQTFRDTLKTLAGTAGYGEVHLIDEPRGALLYHVFHKDIPPGDALKGLLAIDFGGGTCDFAFMRRGTVQRSWGDMHLGGRLFDDLFFQWFVDCNPGALDIIRHDGNEYFIHSFLCREVKEFFSRTMARDRDEQVTKALRHYGKLTGMTWSEFVTRAQTYQATTSVMEYTEVAAGGRSDLLSWFRTSLSDGLLNAGINKSDITCVILSGGSSQWPFVIDTVIDELGIDQSRILRSDRPYAAISEGLAILPALRRQFTRVQGRLKAELSGILSQRLIPLIEKRIRSVAEGVAESVMAELFDDKLRPILTGFCDRGGSVASLKQQIAGAASAFEGRLRSITEERLSGLSKGLPGDVSTVVGEWFGEHGLAVPDYLNGLPAPQTSSEPFELDMPDLYDRMGRIVTTAGSAIIGLLTSMICGGSGMALIASGPLGLLVGVVIGMAVGALVLTRGVDKAKKTAEDWDVPKWMRKVVLSDAKIKEMRDIIAGDIRTSVASKCDQMQQELETQVRMQVDREIDALNELNQL